jgi:multimeric flavodoxin WrbA
VSTPETPVRATVLCIAGSPRRGGNSDQLLDALIAGVESAGATAIRLRAADAGAHTCRGCNACSQTGECVVRDGMDAVYTAVDAADAIVVSTPVYFATVPAVLKTLYDRFQPYWARRYVLGEPACEPRRPGALLVVGGGGDPFGTGCAITPTKSVMNVLAVSLLEVFECVGPDSASDMGHHPEALERARTIGVHVAEAALRQRAEAASADDAGDGAITVAD